MMNADQERLWRDLELRQGQAQTQRRPITRLRLVWHFILLLIAAGCFVAYGHFKLDGRPTAAIVSLIAAAILGFAPIRDILRVLFRVEGTALHVAHAVGAMGLIALPVTGAVSGVPFVSQAWRAPFAIMGAAQAMMGQQHPRNAKQAAALQMFATRLPEVARFADSKEPLSPANAARAISVLTDLIGRAEALGETELDADPGFQTALRQLSARLGANLGLDAVDLALRNLAGNPSAASAVPGLQHRLAQARQTIER